MRVGPYGLRLRWNNRRGLRVTAPHLLAAAGGGLQCAVTWPPCWHGHLDLLGWLVPRRACAPGLPCGCECAAVVWCDAARCAALQQARRRHSQASSQRKAGRRLLCSDRWAAGSKGQAAAAPTRSGRLSLMNSLAWLNAIGAKSGSTRGDTAHEQLLHVPQRPRSRVENCVPGAAWHLLQAPNVELCCVKRGKDFCGRWFVQIRSRS